MAIQCLLWDFGDTLCDERFIWGTNSEWMQIYETFEDGGLGDQWCLGEINSQEFAQALTKKLPLSRDEIIDHMIHRSRQIQYFTKTYEYFRARQLPQAIVTVNPDLFSEIIVPHYRLDQACDAIVTSWEEQTTDKRILNRLAIERLGLQFDPGTALLIDNKLKNIEDWQGVGGAGYHYTSDEKFSADFASGVP